MMVMEEVVAVMTNTVVMETRVVTQMMIDSGGRVEANLTMIMEEEETGTIMVAQNMGEVEDAWAMMTATQTEAGVEAEEEEEEKEGIEIRGECPHQAEGQTIHMVKARLTSNLTSTIMTVTGKMTSVTKIEEGEDPEAEVTGTVMTDTAMVAIIEADRVEEEEVVVTAKVGTMTVEVEEEGDTMIEEEEERGTMIEEVTVEEMEETGIMIEEVITEASHQMKMIDSCHLLMTLIARVTLSETLIVDEETLIERAHR
jgi:hypothetical protein